MSDDGRLHRALVENLPCLLWHADASGERDWFNPAWLAFTGRTLDQERHGGWLEGLPPDEAESCAAALRAQVLRRGPFELAYHLRRADGTYRRVLDQATPVFDAEGVFTGFVGTSIELPERPSWPGRAAAFFERSLDYLCVAGFDGYFRRLNPSWTRTLGWTPEEMLSRPSITFVHPDDRAATLAGRDRLVGGGDLGRLVNRYLCKGGGYRWLEWRSIADLSEELVYCTARDVTEQIEAEARLREAERRQADLERQLIHADRMASVGTLAAGVAHEINNPLAAVTANLDLIAEEIRALPSSPALDELRDLATDARAGADRIRNIVRGLKTFSRADEEKRVVFDPRVVLDLSIDMTFNEIRHRARLVKRYGDVPLVEGDDARLAQVFINLLVNATQALPDDPDRDANEIVVATRTDAQGRAVIEVGDNGCGIADDIRHRVFEPFFTTKPVGVGTGLGLWICHDIVRAFGGDIRLDSVPGSGTTFRVVLPATTGVPTRAEARTVADEPTRPRSGSVLVVDDEASVRAALVRLLRDHVVTAVPTAREALALVRAGQRFDAVLSDMMMPDLSGMDLHEALTGSAPDLARRVVFLTGGAFTPTARAYLDRVPNERLDKPFDPKRLRDLVQRLVDER